MLSKQNETNLTLVNDVDSNNNRMKDIMQKFILKNDLSCLTMEEKLIFILNRCKDLKLDPRSQPIMIIKSKEKVGNSFVEKETPYISKSGGEQLAKVHQVSVLDTEEKILDDVFIVKAKVSLPNGRISQAIGVTPLFTEYDGKVTKITGAKKCNAMMVADTKARRRAVLSICGTGMIDESEIDTMNVVAKINPYEQKIEPVLLNQTVSFNQIEDFDKKLDDYKTKIYLCSNLDDLKSVFKEAYTQNWGSEKENYIGTLTQIKDDKKKQIEDLINDEVPL